MGPADAMGSRHSPAKPGARIVSLVPSITELLFELGLAEQVVGRTTFCVHPEAPVAEVPRVGGTKKVNLERLGALEPTHVIVNVDENTREDVDEIRRFTPHVIVTHPIEPRDNLDLFRLLGHVFNVGKRAEALCEGFETAYAVVVETARGLPPLRVLYLIWREPWMTVSPDTYISRVLSLVNWETVGGSPETRYPEVELDEAILAGTDLILLSSEPFPFKPKHAVELRERLGTGARPIEPIDAEMVSWYGSRAIAGLEYLDRFARACASRG